MDFLSPDLLNDPCTSQKLMIMTEESSSTSK